MYKKELNSISYYDQTFKRVILYKDIKNITVRIVEGNIISISAPLRVKETVVLEFLESVQEKLIKSYIDREQNKIFNINKNGYIYINGEKFEIVFTKKDGYTKSYIKEGKIICTGSEDKLKKSIINLLKKEVFSFWNERVEFWSKTMDIPKPKLAIKHMKSAWGVYHTDDNEIVLNISLISFNQFALEYLVIHELCHYYHPDHSKNFWKLVEKYCNDYKKIRKYMNNYNSY